MKETVNDALSLTKGYKQTEVGLIPEDWNVLTYGELFKVLGGGTFKSKDRVSDGARWLKIANVGIREIKWDELEYLPISFLEEYNSFLLKENDIVMALTRPILGRNLKISKLSGNDVPCLLNQRVGKIEPNSGYDLKWLFHLLQSNKSINGFLDSMAGTDPPNLSNKGIYAIKTATPPTLSEQKAIATALSDVDELIANLDKLITKKKAIKQGAMQQLLTPPHKGGKRLAGFTGEWVEKSIGKIGATYGGLSGKSKNDFENGNYPYITFLNVMYNTVIDTSIFEYVKIGAGEQQNQTRNGDLFFNTSSETPEEVGMCAYLNEDIHNLYLNSFCFGFRLKEESEVDGLFFSYLINSSIGRKLFLSLAQGATRYNLSKSNFNKLFINVPNTKKEQKAISQILSDMDTEIEQLETKKAKYQNMKQGMMQELLTGKTRLV